MMLRPLFAVTASLAVGVDAFWRMECPGRVGLASIDPIVNPGAIAPHIHAIHGSSGTFIILSTASELLSAYGINLSGDGWHGFQLESFVAFPLVVSYLINWS